MACGDCKIALSPSSPSTSCSLSVTCAVNTAWAMATPIRPPRTRICVMAPMAIPVCKSQNGMISKRVASKEGRDLPESSTLTSTLASITKPIDT